MADRWSRCPPVRPELRAAPLLCVASTPFLETLTDAFTFSPASVVQGQGRYPLPTWRSCSLCVGGWAYSLLQTSFLFQALTVFISLLLSSCRHVRQETVCLQEAASSQEQQPAAFPVLAFKINVTSWLVLFCGSATSVFFCPVICTISSQPLLDP